MGRSRRMKALVSLTVRPWCDPATLSCYWFSAAAQFIRTEPDEGEAQGDELPGGGKDPVNFPREVVTQCVEKTLRNG